MTSAAPPVEEPSLARRLAAETLGTLLLLATVVGSGIMAERLTHDLALALLCNPLATGAMLFVLIVLFAPISGAHFNPAVTMVRLLDRAIPPGVAARAETTSDGRRACCGRSPRAVILRSNRPRHPFPRFEAGPALCRDTAR